jgi:protein-S-isoprenylcysteine O-methyltransferase Ste14
MQSHFYDFIVVLRVVVALIGLVAFVWTLRNATLRWETYNHAEKCMHSYVILSAYGMILTSVESILIHEVVTVRSFAYLFASMFLLIGLWLTRNNRFHIDSPVRHDHEDPPV